MLKEKQLRDYVNGYSFQNAMGLRGYEEINLFPLGCGEYNLNYSFVHPITGKRLVLRVSDRHGMAAGRSAELSEGYADGGGDTCGHTQPEGAGKHPDNQAGGPGTGHI